MLKLENKMNEDKIKNLIDERIRKVIDFTARKVTDTPTDGLQVTPRKYVTRNSTTALRPTTSVLGEFYFDNTIKRTVTWNGTNYQDPAGNVV